MVSAVAGRSMAMAPSVVAGKQRVERGEQVIVRACTELDDDDARGRVRHEDVEEAAALTRDEGGALVRQVEEPAVAPGPDRELGGLQGNMARMASRTRPRIPRAGADS